MFAYNPHIKRLVDIALCMIALFSLSPLFLFLAILIRIESKGSPFFFHERVGKKMVPFQLIKFRSMLCENYVSKGQFNPGDKSRVTRVGKFLRKIKIDELPELINVLKGDMSIIGPRPEVARYIRMYPEDFKTVLKIRPGISDYASIKYRDEEEILATKQDPEYHYLHAILPDKLRLAKVYAEKVSFSVDLDIMKETLRSIIGKLG